MLDKNVKKIKLNIKGMDEYSGKDVRSYGN
jgi:hypothetical protein